MSLIQSEEKITYDCRWSTDVDDKFIEDFSVVEREVFGEYTGETFRNKYVGNIYGPSVLVIAYINQTPVAARALWRNDIEGTPCYQPCDTCVLDLCRGKGIFKTMTEKAMDLLPQGCQVYNFPNPNSYPGYIKMGWKLRSEYRERLFTMRRYLKEHPLSMDDEYADWWLKKGDTYKYLKIGKRYFLVSYIGRVCCYRVLAEISEVVAKRYARLMLGVVFYRSKATTFYNKRLLPLRVVSLQEGEILYIPPWKMDAI